MNHRTAPKYREFVLLALFTAIIFILGMTPLGMVPLGLIKATCVHIPVVVGGILLGPKKGALLGGVFGLVSFISNTTSPALLSFAFSPLIPLPGTGHGSLWALLVCFGPRLLVGVAPALLYRLLKNYRGAKQALSLSLAGVCGAVVNTAFVMGLIALLFQQAYATAKGIPVTAVLAGVWGVIATNGVAELLLAAVLVPAICKPLLRLMGNGAR